MSNNIIIDNRTIKKIQFSDLIKYNVSIPNEQRIVNEIKVNEIVTYQLDFLKHHNKMNFLGIINLHKYDGHYYLVDGHHRFQACKKLFNEYSHNVCLVVEIVQVDEYQELKNNYSLINKNTTLPEFPENIDKNIPEQTAQYFMNKYPQVWSQSTRCKRPHINFNYFQETLCYLTDKLPNITSSNDLIKEITEYNNVIAKWNIKNFTNINETMYNKAKEWKLYLCLFNHVSNQEYGYEWARKLVEHTTGEKVAIIKIKNTRKGIPKKIKNDSWDLYVGSQYGKAYCIVCETTEINSKNFEAGHIISDKNGGKNTVDNIIPICGQCNKCMSDKNMNDYIKEFHPNNYDNFKNKKYRKIETEKRSLLGLW